jgi:hypothetical protein
MSDGELVELLHTQGDGLPRDVVDEFLDRGPRMIPLLYVIVGDKGSWTQPPPQWWAAVHATYILGAYESPETLSPLLAALRWADAFDNEWVAEDLPSILGKLGRAAYAPLQAVARDVSAGWGARSLALTSLAAVTITAPFLRKEFLSYAAQIAADVAEPVPLRQAAANILLDFRAKEHRSVLLRFGKEEAQRKEELPDYEGAFYDWEVDQFLKAEDRAADLAYYEQDWLVFYDPEERQHRRDYWAETEAEASKSQPAEPRKGHRVTLCPCGSGKPYEECCVNKLH